MVYKSYDELETTTLQYDDVVIFYVNKKQFTYEVTNSFLGSRYSHNDIIFEKLNIKDRYNFCEKCYKYPPFRGLFPQCKIGDYKALTRIALELFKLCDNYSGTPLWE